MAFDACQQAITINQKSVTRLKKTVESTTSATQTAADAVADPQTIDNLKAAIDKVGDVKQAENSCSPDAEADQNLAQPSPSRLVHLVRRTRQFLMRMMRLLHPRRARML
jgi:uncharacterized protein YktB (UPF0637 family)